MTLYPSKLREVTLLCDHRLNECNHYSLFRLAPFVKGQALPVATTLRRVLLNELDAFAITGARFVGAAGPSHELDCLPGVRETLPHIVRGLRDIVFSMTDLDALIAASGTNDSNTYMLEIEPDKDLMAEPENEGPRRLPPSLIWPATLHGKGKMVLTAGDVCPPPGLTVVNPDQHLATLVSPHAAIDLELTISHGKTYMSCVDQMYTASESTSLSVIPVDGRFAPVHRVNYFIKQQYEYEFILLEVWTNGSITPSQSLGKASVVIKQLFQPFV